MNCTYFKQYIKYNCKTNDNLYQKLFLVFNRIKHFKTNKKKNKCKYKFNLLNTCYTYSYSYLARYIYKNIYKLDYVKDGYIATNNNINTIVLNYNKIFMKRKQKKEMKYDVAIGSGSSRFWVGIGHNTNTSYKNACDNALSQSKRYIYNLQFKSNDYKIFKYKNYKFTLLDKVANKRNFTIYNNLVELSGVKKLKLISYIKAPTKTILRAILHYFN
uniref:Ribosomal protein S5 n=1 Tax=Babesia orientalis TaxID=273649 RepID=A0A0M4MF11_9APIC|nr:ribosomal protein S5 [Babesia orientalis]ALE29368.1 ribosomal protein S5 [Babesia orientalis]